MRVLTVTLSDGQQMKLNYDLVYSAAQLLVRAGMMLATVPQTSRRNSSSEERAISDEILVQAYEYLDWTLVELQVSVENLVTQAVHGALQTAFAAELHYKCSQCGDRFATVQQLVNHTQVEDSTGQPLRPDCFDALEQSLRMHNEAEFRPQH